jgi:hypothetical protein
MCGFKSRLGGGCPLRAFAPHVWARQQQRPRGGGGGAQLQVVRHDAAAQGGARARVPHLSIGYSARLCHTGQAWNVWPGALTQPCTPARPSQQQGRNVMTSDAARTCDVVPPVQDRAPLRHPLPLSLLPRDTGAVAAVRHTIYYSSQSKILHGYSAVWCMSVHKAHRGARRWRGRWGPRRPRRRRRSRPARPAWRPPPAAPPTPGCTC